MKKIIYIIVASFLAGFLFIKFYSLNYFDFDEVIHYKSNISEEKANYLFEDKTELGKFIKDVVIENIPKSIKDTTFIDKVEKIGFKKTTIEDSKFDKINEIFSNKFHLTHEVSACIYIYRDILIFKKKSKIVGMAKICFGCGGSQIYGAKQNTDGFGQSGDYQKLETLLNEKK